MGHYQPSTRAEQQQMLQACGVANVADFFADVPDSVLLQEPLHLPAGKSELEVRQALTAMGAKIKCLAQFYAAPELIAITFRRL